MDRTHVKTLAAEHAEQLTRAWAAADQRVGLTFREIFDRDFPAIHRRLDEEAVQYCEAYNEGFGSEKLETHNHEHGINVMPKTESRWGARIFFSPRDHRLEDCLIECGRGHHESFAVKFREQDGRLILTLDENPISEEKLVTMLCDRFTEKLVELETAAV